MEPTTNPAISTTAIPPKEVGATTPPNSNPTDPVPAQPFNQPNPENSNKRKKKLLITVIVIAILVLAAALYFFVLKHPTAQTNNQNTGGNGSQQQAQINTNSVINDSITNTNDSLDLGSLV